MADDFQVKQSSSNAGAYGLTGAALGATAGGLGSYYLTKPKYASHQEIIDEAKDSADFKSRLEKAEGDEKKFLQAAKDVADEKTNAEKAWEDEFKAYKESHKEGIKKDEKFIELEKQQEEFQNKIKELETKAGTANTAAGTVKKDPLKAIRENVKAIDNAREELRLLKADNAPKEAIDKVTARLKKYEENLNTVYDKIVESTEFDLPTKKATEEAKAKYRAELQEYAQRYGNARDKFNTKLPENGYKIAKSNIAKEESAITEALAKIKELTAHKGTIEGQDFAGYDLTESLKNNKGFNNGNRQTINGKFWSKSSKGEYHILKSNMNVFDKEMNAILKVEANKTKVLENLLSKYNAQSTNKTQFDLFDRTIQAIRYIVKKEPIPSGVANIQEIEDFIKNISDPKEKELINKIVDGKEVNKETLEELLKASKERTSALEKAASTIVSSKSAIATLEADIAAKQKEVVKKFGEGAYINEEGIICKKGKPIQKAKTPVMQLPEFKTECDVKLPTEIEVNGKPKPAAPSQELVDARKKLEEITKQIDEAKKNLPKGELKPEEQLAEFAKSKGVKDKNEFVSNQIKEKTDKFAKDFESQFKRKWGFAEHTNWKIAGAAAAGAAILGVIMSALAPNKNQA